MHDKGGWVLLGSASNVLNQPVKQDGSEMTGMVTFLCISKLKDNTRQSVRGVDRPTPYRVTILDGKNLPLT